METGLDCSLWELVGHQLMVGLVLSLPGSAQVEEVQSSFPPLGGSGGTGEYVWGRERGGSEGGWVRWQIKKIQIFFLTSSLGPKPWKIREKGKILL